MTTAPTPPRANALACEYRPSMPADVLHLWAKDAVAELIRLQSENERISPDRAIRMQQNDRMAERIAELEAQLVAEARATAEHKLRADQLAQQHRMQAQMHAQATQQLAGIEANKNARIHKLEMDALDLASENSILKRQEQEELEARKPLPLSDDDRLRLRSDVARAIWDVMREHDDRCGHALEDVDHKHQVWDCADAAIKAAHGITGGSSLTEQEKVEWARRCALEEAARVCDGKVQNATDWDSSYWDQASESCSLSIRAMKDKPC